MATFEKEFPSLKGKDCIRYRGFTSNGGFEQLFFLDETLMKNCLDKQRVKEAIIAVIDNDNYRERTIEKALFERLRL